MLKAKHSKARPRLCVHIKYRLEIETALGTPHPRNFRGFTAVIFRTKWSCRLLYVICAWLDPDYRWTILRNPPSEPSFSAASSFHARSPPMTAHTTAPPLVIPRGRRVFPKEPDGGWPNLSRNKTGHIATAHRSDTRPIYQGV